MKATQDNYVDVRYSKFYAIINTLLGLVFLALAVDDIISLKEALLQSTNFIFPFLYVLVGFIFLPSGLFLSTRKYFRLDKENKILLVYGIIGPWSRKYPFDFMYYAKEKFFIEKGGKKKKIGFTKYTCNRTDLNAFLKELSALNKETLM